MPVLGLFVTSPDKDVLFSLRRHQLTTQKLRQIAREFSELLEKIHSLGVTEDEGPFNSVQDEAHGELEIDSHTVYFSRIQGVYVAVVAICEPNSYICMDMLHQMVSSLLEVTKGTVTPLILAKRDTDVYDCLVTILQANSVQDPSELDDVQTSLETEVQVSEMFSALAIPLPDTFSSQGKRVYDLGAEFNAPPSLVTMPPLVRETKREITGRNSAATSGTVTMNSSFPESKKEDSVGQAEPSNTFGQSTSDSQPQAFNPSPVAVTQAPTPNVQNEPFNAFGSHVQSTNQTTTDNAQTEAFPAFNAFQSQPQNGQEAPFNAFSSSDNQPQISQSQPFNAFSTDQSSSSTFNAFGTANETTPSQNGSTSAPFDASASDNSSTTQTPFPAFTSNATSEVGGSSQGFNAFASSTSTSAVSTPTEGFNAFGQSSTAPQNLRTQQPSANEAESLNAFEPKGHTDALQTAPTITPPIITAPTITPPPETDKSDHPQATATSQIPPEKDCQNSAVVSLCELVRATFSNTDMQHFELLGEIRVGGPQDSPPANLTFQFKTATPGKVAKVILNPHTVSRGEKGVYTCSIPNISNQPVSIVKYGVQDGFKPVPLVPRASCKCEGNTTTLVLSLSIASHFRMEDIHSLSVLVTPSSAVTSKVVVPAGFWNKTKGQLLWQTPSLTSKDLLYKAKFETVEAAKPTSLLIKFRYSTPLSGLGLALHQSANASPRINSETSSNVVCQLSVNPI